jgi:hypothetical protein
MGSLGARRFAISLITCLALGGQDALWADTPGECRLIDDFVKDIEAGELWLADARFTLIESKTDAHKTVRRYSMRSPHFEPSELMQLEIIDAPNDRVWEAKAAVRRLRVRPHSVSYWTAVMPSVVGLNQHEHGGFSIHFESKDGALAVAFLFKLDALAERKPNIDRAILAMGERWCADPHMIRK